MTEEESQKAPKFRWEESTLLGEAMILSAVLGLIKTLGAKVTWWVVASPVLLWLGVFALVVLLAIWRDVLIRRENRKP